jgi:uncharacterized delta-60 repeat protein
MGTVDVVSFRFTTDGKRDDSWATGGASVLDLIGGDDRGRSLVALPDDRILILGSGTPMAGNVDAMAVVLQPNGALDATFDNDGYKLFSFGRPEDAFFGAAVSPDGKWALGTGYRAGMVAGMTEDDDATLLLLPLVAGGGAELAAAVPVSDTSHDRFWAAAFDASNRAYGAGFVSEGGDSRMVVARFSTAGARDAAFGMNGVATVNVSVGPGVEEAARGIVVQSDGKIVLAGVFEKRP